MILPLTERTYFFGGGFYTTTFYVGDNGVLLFDPSEGQGANVLAAIAEVTSVPVTAIVYSHNHADHIIGTTVILDAARAADVKNVRIIASAQTDAKMKLLKSSLPAPTETVAWPNGSFEFEGLTVQLNGCTRAAHTDDAAALLLVQEKVAHLPGLVNGDQPPFRNFGTAENYVYYRPNVNELGALDWVHLVGVALWLTAVTTTATDELRPKYGELYGFEITAPANAEMVALAMVSYR